MSAAALVTDHRCRAGRGFRCERGLLRRACAREVVGAGLTDVLQGAPAVAEDKHGKPGQEGQGECDGNHS